jgi:hypothetical protein
MSGTISIAIPISISIIFSPNDELICGDRVSDLRQIQRLVERSRCAAIVGGGAWNWVLPRGSGVVKLARL